MFMVRQLQEKYLAKLKKTYLAFPDVEKIFDRALRDVLGWTMCKVEGVEWFVCVVQAIYANTMSSDVRVEDTLR